MTWNGVYGTFEVWYRREHTRVISVVYAVTGDTDVAEDATDEAFARALASWDRVEMMRWPEAWVCQVALNVTRRRLRRRNLERRLLGRQLPAHLMSGDERDPAVWAAVRALPERQRLAVVQRYVGDLTEAQTASALGVTRGTVSASLSAARHRLSGLIDDPDPAGRLEKETPRG